MHPFAPQPFSAPQKAPHFFLPNAKKEEALRLLPYGFRQRPILPGRVQPSTFGTEGLNFCVRNGNRWDPFVITTGNCELVWCRSGDYCILPLSLSLVKQ